MIIFDLNCHNGHRFEGWFQSAEALDAQRAGGLLSCPVCGSADVRRVPSALHLTRAPEEAPPARPAKAPVADPRAELLAAYRKFVAAIMANSEDVGEEFASEARRIHYLEAPERPIRGQTSDEEFEALRDEGIGVLRVPVPKKEDLN
jgi:hypothetical protein